MKRQIRQTYRGLTGTIIGFAWLLAVLTIWCGRLPADAELNMYMAHSAGWSVVRALIVAVLTLVAVVPVSRIRLLKFALSAGGCALMGVSVASLLIGSPVYIHLLDFFICMEAGTLSLLAAMQLSWRGKRNVSKPEHNEPPRKYLSLLPQATSNEQY